MSEYKRARLGTTYFFTVVTYNRQPILCQKPCPDILRSIMLDVQQKYPFSIDAMVLLPEHLHCIWTMAQANANYSMRWGLIKKEFTKQVRTMVGTAHPTEPNNKDVGWAVPARNDCQNIPGAARQTQSRLKHREGVIWQRRFWEHELRDDADYAAHFDYIHYNPVKHGYASSPGDWPYSSFHRHASAGKYDAAWGAGTAMEFSPAVGNE